MWHYEKKLQYPAKVCRPDLKMAKNLFTQYGGPDGELAAGVRYLTQRYSMPLPLGKAVLTDIGTEEFAHWEIIATLIFKLVDGASAKDIEKSPLAPFFAIRDKAIFPVDSDGVPWTAAYIQAMGDPVANMHEDMAAEQKARTVYEQLISMTDDRDLIDTLSFLREREVVHFQRFGETLMRVYEYYDGGVF